jgi:guanylate kinase
MSKKQGLFVIISSPTGGGKDTAIKELLSVFPRATRIVTTTSRLPRSTDAEGTTINFTSLEDFEKKIKEGYFLEYNNYAGNYYGTPKKQLEESLVKYDLVFSNIDVNGKHSLDKLGISHVSFFLVPESMEILRQRIEKRGGLTPEMIDRRINIASQEIEESKDYDYKIINYEGKLDQTVDQLATIIKQHLKGTNQS